MLNRLRVLTPAEVQTFPYPKPWDALPWQPITGESDLPFDEWVWVGDRQHNIYPAARTTGGLAVPNMLDLPARLRANLIDRPIVWLPFRPDHVALLIGQHIPRIMQFRSPGHGRH